MTKVCSQCKAEKDISDFNPKGTRHYQSYCRVCQSITRKAYYVDNTQKELSRSKATKISTRKNTLTYINEYLKSHPCIDCGETDLIVLDFDHIDPKKKLFNIGSSYRDVSLYRIKEEITKCEIRCANCHRRKTYRQRGFTSRSV